MPRGFSQDEKERIRDLLIEHGRALLGNYGARRTSVDELTAAAGISKGSFYTFFPSKEELFFTIFEQFEQSYRAELLQLAGRRGGTPHKRVAAFLHQAVTMWRTNPLFTRFTQEEYQYVARKIAPERLEQHLRDDEQFAVRLLETWRRTGLAVTCTPAEFTGLTRALFFVSLHAEEFGGDSYRQTIALLIDLAAAHMTRPQGEQAPA
jgi:AcrR family transcriptional regulator